MPGIGDMVGDYEIAAKLKSGGMATLYLGRRAGAAGFARHVAIKLVHPHLSDDANFIAMFIDEAKLSARIQHPNVVHVEQFGDADGCYYLVMEYVHGCSLSQLMKGLGQRRRRLSPDVAVSIAMKLAEGLHAAHETRGDDGELLGVVHRDVSPQNVLLAYKGHVKLIDFGIAKARGRSQETAAGLLKGKFRYMAPEQAAGLPVDRRSDVYALGIVLWEMLTGRRLFKADNDLLLLDMVRSPKTSPPSTQAPGIPPALDAVVMKALAPNVDDRYASANDLRRGLAQAVPEAFIVDSERVAALLKTIMGEEILSVQNDLPGSVSELVSESALKKSHQQVGSGVQAPPGPKAAADEEILHTMTLSVEDLEAFEASHGLGPSPLGGPVSPELPRVIDGPPTLGKSPPDQMTPSGSVATTPTATLGRPDGLPLARLGAGLAAIACVAFVAGYFMFGSAETSTTETVTTSAAPPPATVAGNLPALADPPLAVPVTPVANPPEVVDAGAASAPAPAQPELAQAPDAPAVHTRPTRPGRGRGRHAPRPVRTPMVVVPVMTPVAVMTPVVVAMTPVIVMAPPVMMRPPRMRPSQGDPFLVDDDF